MKNKKLVTGIIVAIIIILVLVAIWLFTTGMKPKDGDNDNDDSKLNDTPSPTPGSGTYVPSGPSSPTSIKCTNDAFPLGVGSRNQCVVALQRALGISQDGIFGQQTKGAVNARGYVVPLTHSDFDKIIGISSGSWRAGDPVYLKGIGATIDIFVLQSTVGMKKIGSINNYFSAYKKIGKYKGPSVLAGTSSITLDQPIAGTTQVFVRTDAISKTA